MVFATVSIDLIISLYRFVSFRAKKTHILSPQIFAFRARAWRKEGVGGRNSATPERKTEAAPAALLVRAEQHKKVFFSF